MASQSADATKEIIITREFEAARERVWKAWTDPDWILRWWGPEHFTAPSIMLDLKVGGKYTWAMRGPAGTPWDRTMYNSGVFEEIIPNEKLVLTQYMSDERGAMLNPSASSRDAGDFPREMRFTVLFEELDKGRTRLSIIYPKPETEAQYQALLKSGMVEGWTASLNKMAAALS